MDHPQVTVICLCYNHEAFLQEALDSVSAQTYPNLQVIIVDDASTDGSQQQIQHFAAIHPTIQTLLLSHNVGNCKAFNLGLELATGDFVIDFSTDDVMVLNRIEKQISFFGKLDRRVGVVFTDAIYINENGVPFRNHFDYLLAKKLVVQIPTGDVFRAVLTTYFICSPTMMIRKEVLDRLGGYDAELAYEDFDFWVRASRVFHFALLNEKLTKVRKSSKSMSAGWYEQGDRQLHSTYLVCQKALKLCANQEDRKALQWRVLYEFKQSVFSKNTTESKLFSQLLKIAGKIPASFYVIRWLSIIPLPWRWIRKKYYRLVYS